MASEPRRQELRRRPRNRVSWPVIVAVDNRLLHGETLDLGPFGVKLRLEERLDEGTAATLHIRPPDDPPLDVEALVWRTDEDGSVFFFIKKAPARLQLQPGLPASL
jgi:PilZ domain-containing protein